MFFFSEIQSSKTHTRKTLIFFSIVLSIFIISTTVLAIPYTREKILRSQDGIDF